MKYSYQMALKSQCSSYRKRLLPKKLCNNSYYKIKVTYSKEVLRSNII